MGLRLLLLLIVVLLVLWLARRLLTRPDPPRQQPESRMVRCAHCGLHVPVDEAVTADGDSYCCEAHRRAGRAD